MTKNKWKCDKIAPLNLFKLLVRLAGGKASVRECQSSLGSSEKTVLAAFRKMLDGNCTYLSNQTNFSPISPNHSFETGLNHPYITLFLDGLIRRKGAGYIVEKRKQGATPSFASAVDDTEVNSSVEDSAVFETAPAADRTHDTYELT